MSDAFKEDCVFCPENGKVSPLVRTALAYAVEAREPPIPGCILIIPKRHIESFFELPGDWTSHEQTLLGELMGIEVMKDPTWYTPSWNLRHETGQRIPHLHHWWIPRYGERDTMAEYLGTASLIADARKRDYYPSNPAR